nr:hypothetical protein Iba_chr10dCG14990 [Ipomoea batatas]
MTIEKVVGNDLSKEPFLPAKQQAHLPQQYSSEEHDVLVAYPLVHELVQQVLWWQVEEVVPPIQLLLAPQVLPPIHPDKNITYYSQQLSSVKLSPFSLTSQGSAQHNKVMVSNEAKALRDEIMTPRMQMIFTRIKFTWLEKHIKLVQLIE